MKQSSPVILHHKYSLEDGHVTKQITSVEGFRGMMIVRKAKEYRKSTPFKSVITLKELKSNPQFLKQANVVAFHIHHGSQTTKYEFLKEKYGLPMFVGFRGNDATAFPRKKKNLKQLKRLFKTADMFFPVCEHLKRRIMQLGCPEDKIRVLYGGLDLNRFEYRPRKLDSQDNIRFLAVGRFVEKKGFHHLLRAFARVRKTQKNITLTLIGRGPYETEYARLINKLNLKKNVEIVPWVDYQKIQSKYYSSHIFCAPSITDQNGNQEGIPNTLKEAMATGMPVISTTHAGIPELVKNNVSGLLVPEGSVKQLEKAMKWLIEHPEQWAKFGENARKKVEADFNLAIQLKKQKEFYNEVLLKQQ